MGSQEDLNRCTGLCAEDFEKARMALEKANVAGPIRIIVNTDEWSPKQWKLYEMMEEMANAPKEPVGERQPGERGAYETKRCPISGEVCDCISVCLPVEKETIQEADEGTPSKISLPLRISVDVPGDYEITENSIRRVR